MECARNDSVVITALLRRYRCAVCAWPGLCHPLTIKNAVIEYHLIRSQRKSIQIRIGHDHRIEVRAPLYVSKSQIDAFVRSKENWITARLRALPEAPPTGPRYAEGCAIDVLGRSRTITWCEGPKKTCYLQPDTLDVIAPAGVRSQVPEQVELFLREVARQVFEGVIAVQFPWFAARGHTRPVLRVKKMKTRWGSLSERGYINLNMELLHRPVAAMEYVIMHELCHLEYMHHGPAFHRLMTQRMPDWRARKALL